MITLSMPVALIDGKPIYSELDRYYKLCFMVSSKIARNYGMMHLYEDLVQQSVIKMLECLERYDGETGQFWTYADYRVTGHILDRIRKETHSRNVKQYTYLPIEDSPDLQHELVYKHDFPLFCDMQNMILPKLDRTKDILEAAILCGNLRKAAKVYGVTESRVCQITSEFKRNNSDVFS